MMKLMSLRDTIRTTRGVKNAADYWMLRPVIGKIPESWHVFFLAMKGKGYNTEYILEYIDDHKAKQCREARSDEK